jgi:hypothetical protein
MSVLALTTALLLSALPPPVEAWAHKACPPPREEPESNVELKAQAQKRAECLRKGMNKALDRILLPLKKEKAPSFKEWMALQADYNRWMAEACTAVEEAHWVDLSTGERAMGTGYGSTETQCLQQQYAWRGFYADAWARKDWKALTQAQEAFGPAATRARDSLTKYRAQVGQAAARPPPAEDAESPVRPLSQEEWVDYTARLERAGGAPEALARRQCALLPEAPANCSEKFALTLYSYLDFSEALSGQAQNP